MRYSSRLTIAIHILLYIATYETEEKITSEVLSDTTGIISVNIRKILGQLKNAGFIQVKSGVGGTYLNRNLSEITLLDVFLAVEETEQGLFRQHENPNTNCPVGRNIETVFENRLESIERTMLLEMKNIRLSDMHNELQGLLVTQKK